ncbi:MAG: glycosyltransferase family 87 protein [Anaerolineales bacterium]
MSFQEFQKAPNKLTTREIGFILLALVVGALVIYALAVGNYYLANTLPDGGEFYLLRTGGRSFMLDRIEPYSASVPERVQKQVYGRPAAVGEDVYILDIPFHLLVIFFPFGLFPDASMARAFWMALSEIALAIFIYFSFRALGRKLPYVFITAIAIAGFTSFYVYRSFLEGSPAIFLGLAYVGILLSLRVGRDELAGALMALSAFQWEMGGPFLLFIVLWVFWKKRWRVFAGAGMLAFILLTISFFLYPGWVLPFLRAAWNSFRASSGFSAHDILAQLWPQFGSTLGWVLTAILIVTLGSEWRAVRDANFNRFTWAVCLTLAATPLLGYRMEMDQLVVLTMPIMLVILISRERWRKLGNGIAFLLLIFLFGLPWLLYVRGVPPEIGLQSDELLFLFWPVFAVIGLYWVRWWMIHPPRTWLDSFQSKGGR